MRTDHHRFATTCVGKAELAWSEAGIFYLDDVSALPEGLPGVYILSACTPLTPALTPFYVGQSADLRRRLAEHLLGHRTFARHLRHRVSTYFTVAQVAHPLLRTAVEAALIRRLQPVGNDVLPSAPLIQVNLPSFHLIDP